MTLPLDPIDHAQRGAEIIKIGLGTWLFVFVGFWLLDKLCGK